MKIERSIFHIRPSNSKKEVATAKFRKLREKERTESGKKNAAVPAFSKRDILDPKDIGGCSGKETSETGGVRELGGGGQNPPPEIGNGGSRRRAQDCARYKDGAGVGKTCNGQRGRGGSSRH